jgi:hypothetical protein
VSGTVDGNDGELVHLTWRDHRPRLGDGISIRVIDVAEVDQPASQEADDPPEEKRLRRQLYEDLKREFGELGRS